jgi:hypothetical protein
MTTQPASRLQSWAASALGALVLLLAVAVVPLSLWARQDLVGNTAELSIGVPMGAVGFLVARRQPRNPIGWLLLVIPAGVLVSIVAGPYSVLVYRDGYHLPFGAAALLFQSAYFFVLFVALPLVLLLFPDGTLPSPRWRWVLWCYLALSISLVAAAEISVIVAGLRMDATGGVAAIDHPAGPTAWLKYLGPILLPIAAFWLVFVGRLALSWRRASGDRREQLKWLMVGCTAAVAGFIVSNLVPVLDPAGTAVGVGLALPVCMGVAILRYRLYDIDRIISRTLAYTIVTALLAGLYAGLVLLATQVLDLTSQVAVAVATLAAAALFNPLRRRVQHRVDRRFNRARYDADNTVAAFAARLQDATDPDAVRSDLVRTVHHALEPAYLTLWTTGPAG